MIEAAEILAEDFPFVRTDFYEVNSIPKFGEMTFYPQSGLDPFDPPEWDFKLGRLWPKESLWRLILMRGRQDDGLQKGSAARR